MLHHNTEQGYSIVELMIAIVIGLLLIIAATGTYIVQKRSHVVQESVSEVNTQSKIAHDLLAGEVRSAGFGLSVELNEEPVNTFTSIITPVDDTLGPDAITVVGGFRMIGTLWPTGSGAVMCPASVEAGTTNVRIKYTGTDGPNLTDKRYLSIDGVETVQVSNCTIGASGICDPDNITLDRPLSQNFPLQNATGGGSCTAAGGGNCTAGRPVYLVEDTTFCVDSDAILHRIRRNANAAACVPAATSDDEAIAENIEDLQFAYAVDVNEDGVMDDQNADGNFDDNDFLNGVDVADPATIMAFRINVLARSDRPDLNYKGMGNPPDQIENRNLSDTNDNFRRRWWRTVTTMRNQ
ncbi:MAG: PilW family protein [Nitrospiraceae bacterium]|nr:MAG: PilW family protein [Nitrospiraceae bacterium]